MYIGPDPTFLVHPKRQVKSMRVLSAQEKQAWAIYFLKIFVVNHH